MSKHSSPSVRGPDLVSQLGVESVIFERTPFEKATIKPPGSSEGTAIGEMEEIRRKFGLGSHPASVRKDSVDRTARTRPELTHISLGVVYAPSGEVFQTLKTPLGTSGTLNVRSSLPNSPQLREAAAIFAGEVKFMEPFISPGKLLDLYIDYGINGALDMNDPHISVGIGYHTQNKAFDLAARHELAHAVFGVISGDYGWSSPSHMNRSQQGEYLSRFNSHFEKAQQNVGGGGPRGSALWHAFTESKYIDLKAGTFGHPYDAPSELFASASTILLTPKLQGQFVEKVQALAPAEQLIAKDIARQVVSYYSNHPAGSPGLFPAELRQFLDKK